MKISKILNLAFILVGAIIAIYANAEASQNQYILILGILFLMIGLYRLSRTIPDKKPKEDSFVVEEKEEND